MGVVKDLWAWPKIFTRALCAVFKNLLPYYYNVRYGLAFYSHNYIYVTGFEKTLRMRSARDLRNAHF